VRSDEELEGLRRAWDDLDAPDPIRDAAQADAQERAALEWMRGAWERVETPASIRWRGAPAERGRRWAQMAAAAAAAAAGIVWFWFAATPTHESPFEPSSPSELGIALAEPRVGSGVPDEGPTAPAKVEVARVTSDRMELRSGSVRLILLTESAGPAAARSEDG
jgi:hypothetical protein